MCTKLHKEQDNFKHRYVFHLNMVLFCSEVIGQGVQKQSLKDLLEIYGEH
jgi:hypothetical protein